MLKPFIKYPGGKARELRYLLESVPANTLRYFEPFVGGGAAYFAMPGMLEYFINDISDELIATYQAVKNQDVKFLNCLELLDNDWKMLSTIEIPSDINLLDQLRSHQMLASISSLDLTEHYCAYLSKMVNAKRQYIQKQREHGNDFSAENIKQVGATVLKSTFYSTVRRVYNQNRAAKLTSQNAPYYYFMREFCYSSMFRFSKAGEFNVPYGGMSYNGKSLTAKLDYLVSPALGEKLRDTEIFNSDFEEFFANFNLDNRDFIFLDPPYDTEFSTYDNSAFGIDDQRRLAAFLKETEAKWLLIIKDSELIRELYPVENEALRIKRFAKNYSVSIQNRNNKGADHLVVTNF
jgi:DNA adenine methylase